MMIKDIYLEIKKRAKKKNYLNSIYLVKMFKGEYYFANVNSNLIFCEVFPLI